jgi:hypothetical protein
VIEVPKAILRALEREAEKRRTVPELVLLELLEKIVPREEVPNAYIETAETMLKHARRLVDEGKVSEALKRVWSSTLLAIKAYAARMGRTVPSEVKEMWKVVDDLAQRVGLRAYHAWYAGIAAYVAEAEGVAIAGHAKAMLASVEDLVRSVRELEAE